MNIPQLIDKTLALSTSDECIVLVQQSSASNIRWANTTLTTNGLSDQTYIAIFAITKGCVGSVVASLDENTNVSLLLKQAEEKTKTSSRAFDRVPLLNGDGSWGSNVANNITGASSDIMYKDLGACFNQAKKQSYELFGFTETRQKGYWMGTSKGLRKSTTHEEATVELNLKTPDFKKSVWTGMVSHQTAGLDVNKLYETLQQKMMWSKKTIALPAGKYETILEPSAVADLLIYGYWSSAARNADEGKSVYGRPGGKNAIGEKLYGKDISIYSDPHDKSMEIPSFEIAFTTSAEQSIFDNGLDFKKTYWIRDGVQEALLTPRYWAQKKDRTASPFIPNLIFDHKKGPNLETMIASTKRGLLVTCLWYIREVDPQNLLLTGLTRDGVFLIENGEISGAVNNFRFNMSPVNMLQQATEIGKSQPARAREFGDYFTFASMPPLRVKNFNMSTVSDAI